MKRKPNTMRGKLGPAGCVVVIAAGLASLVGIGSLKENLDEKRSAHSFNQWKLENEVTQLNQNYGERNVASLKYDQEVLGEEYTVKFGDCLSMIAQNHGMPIRDIRKINPQIKNQNIINVGDKINIINYLKNTEILETETEDSNDYIIPSQISERGVKLIKKSEGFRDEPYWDIKHWAIGYGHKNDEGLTNITEKQASDQLDKDLDSIEDSVSKHVKVSLTQSQYDALCSFTYNFNEKMFKESTLLKKLNKGDYSGASEEFKRWVHKYNKDGSKEVLQGLVIRRQAEYEMFKGRIK